MNFNSNLVLVTGAAGWLGSRLVESLVRGLPDHDALREPRPDLRIRVLLLPGQDATALRKLSDRVEIVTGNMRNVEDCVRFTAGSKGVTLFHTAGIIHPRRVSEFYAVNRDGTVNLLDAAIRAGVKRAVVVSSNSPCGCNPHPDHLFDELSPYHPYMNYGRSKMEMELAVKQRADRIETVIIRAPWFYGPNQPPRQTLFFKMIRDGKAPIVGSGATLRSMAYVDNLCQGLILAAITGHAKGQIYWIADRKPYSMNEIINTIERLLETEFSQKCAHKRMRLPGIASEVAWLADKTLQTLGLYHQKIHVLSEMNKTIACSVTRAEMELGYQPAVALEEGMRRSLRWCAENGQHF
ncbi:MAG: NAD(P)-dependent oxidoreductase [Verrucomicrobia bacterium]|jgi:nucleoside-diphosphate-sugar epimerase|nr:NAD(P)-dependent oxidoreductase [Verrucomicrobiota bacterium]